MISARSNGTIPRLTATPHRVVPFDYAFRFKLEGKPERVLNQTVVVSVEAPFVAVSIGYGVVPEPLKLTLPKPDREIILFLATTAAAVSTGPTLRAVLGGLLALLGEGLGEDGELTNQIGPRTAAALRTGVRLNPAFADLALGAGGTAQLDDGTFQELLQLVNPPPEQVQFLYALFDEGTGREFQSEPLLNTAGLGTPSGD